MSETRLRELIRHHKERALHFEQSSDNGRLQETLAAATPHWEAHDLYRELLAARQQLAELVNEVAGHHFVRNERDRLLQQLAEMRGRWIPWKSGDPLPIHSPSIGNGTYRIAFHMPSGDIAERDSWPGDFAEWEAIAYWSLPLPPNYAAALAPTSQPSRGKCPTCGGTRTNPRWDGMHFSTYDCPDCAQGGSPADPERQGAYDIVAGLREILAGKNVAIDPSIINRAIAALEGAK